LTAHDAGSSKCRKSDGGSHFDALGKLKEDSEYVLKVFFEVKKKVMMMESLGRRVNDGFYRILKDRLSSGSTSSLHRDSTFQPPYTEE
jgi:hypothetical protein